MNDRKQQGSLERMIHIAEKIEDLFIVKVIRDGLITMIPILMIGAFALVLQSFPVTAYQNFITTAAGGFLYQLFHMVYMATFGVMSLYMVLCFSVSYFIMKDPQKPVNMWGVGSAMVSFMIMIGIWNEDFSISDLGATSVFLAIVTSMVSSDFFSFISDRSGYAGSSYSYNLDSRLNSTLNSILPSAATIALAALASFAVTLSGHTTMHELITSFFISAFGLIDDLFAKGLCFIFVSSLLWLIGMHGSDCLQGVSDSVFTPLMDANVAAVAAGGTPHEILCKPFFDCFILMGGCGSSVCLFLAIIIFSRDKGMRNIAKTAGIPLIFNINEILVFGLPIVFNPVMVIPFLSVPVIQYLVSYAAMVAGLVPYITVNIEWTTPVLISGFTSTGSVNGAILQIVNILIGVAVYAPFVRLMGDVKAAREISYREDFVKMYIKNESRLSNVSIGQIRGVYGEIAKRMSMELKDAISAEKYELYYQPQYNYEGRCIGVEALLRWPDVVWLQGYPPLIIRIASDNGLLLDLEKRILKKAIMERELVFRQFGRGIKISVNVTGNSIKDRTYWEYLRELYTEQPFTEGSLCVEVTEQEAIVFDEDIVSEFRKCRDLGIKFAIDDFSAGQTSMEYLKDGLFDMLKLDGSLVRVVNENPRCRDIIASLTTLSDSLHIDCLAEFVENEAIRETLHQIGCDLYQGYLYSPAVPLKRD